MVVLRCRDQQGVGCRECPLEANDGLRIALCLYDMPYAAVSGLDTRLVSYLNPYRSCLLCLMRLLDVLVYAVETHETFHWESGMRYHTSCAVPSVHNI